MRPISQGLKIGFKYELKYERFKYKYWNNIMQGEI